MLVQMIALALFLFFWLAYPSYNCMLYFRAITSERFAITEVTLKITKCHWWWQYVPDHIWLSISVPYICYRLRNINTLLWIETYVTENDLEQAPSSNGKSRNSSNMCCIYRNDESEEVFDI